jgi:hypothetical protein
MRCRKSSAEFLVYLRETVEIWKENPEMEIEGLLERRWEIYPDAIIAELRRLELLRSELDERRILADALCPMWDIRQKKIVWSKGKKGLKNAVSDKGKAPR